MELLVKFLPHRRHPRAVWAALCLLTLWPIPLGQVGGIQAAPDPEDDLEVRATAEVSISTDQQMDFGQLADKDGSVTLGLTDTITTDPQFIHYGGSPYSGIYTITGDPSTAVDISISSTPTSGFTLDTFVSSSGALPLVGVVLTPGGELVLTVGATLTVDSATALVGTGQTISFTITSTYN